MARHEASQRILTQRTRVVASFAFLIVLVAGLQVAGTQDMLKAAGISSLWGRNLPQSADDMSRIPENM